jgi:hypothetical protein
VSLRPSAYAGVTAIVLIPGELVTVGAGPAALPAGRSAPDKSWDRPLVGSGTDDPSRRSLAALQWQGTEELRQVTVTGRPVTINGTATQGLVPPADSDPDDAGPANGRPAPSSVAEGLSADGLVQRRRVRRPIDLGSPRETPAPAEPRSVPRNSLPAMPTSAAPLFPNATPPAATPTSAAPMFSAPTSGAPVEPLDAENGLPRRVRQANLVPQLRRSAASAEQIDTQPLRSPEQVRSIMSALQLGTTRGRIDASRYQPGAVAPAAARQPAATDEKVNEETPSGASFAEAATVSFPAIVDLTVAEQRTASGNGREAAVPESADPATADEVDGPEGNDLTRPEKDA